VLQAAGCIDSIAHDGIFPRGADRTQESHAGVQANADLQRAAAQLQVGFFDHLLHRQGRAHGALGVIFAGGGHAPDCHHGIADVLVNRPAILQDHTIHALPEGIHCLGDFFGVLQSGSGSEARGIRKQDGDLLALLLGALAPERLQALAHGSQPGFDYRITQQGPLSFQSLNGLFEAFDFVHGLFLSRRG